MTFCWLLGHVWSVTFTSRPMFAYRNAHREPLRALFCVCCGAHTLTGSVS